jgi:6-pyruvoyltetrahydropterin/6-carboxytetrahydropterin synthase
MRIALTRRVGFHATHYLRLPELSDAENQARFGATVQPHPHDYTCDVTVSGGMVKGMIVDLGELDAVLAERIVRPLDGTSINDSVPACSTHGLLPTCETIAAWCWEQLVGALPRGVSLERVRIAEDVSLYAECTGTF